MCFPVKFSEIFKSTLFTKHLRWLLFKRSNSNNLFKDFLPISLTHKKSLIICTSQNEKLISKCLQLPKSSHRAVLSQILNKLQGADPGKGTRGTGPHPPKIKHLNFWWQPSFYPAFYFKFVIINLYFLISLFFVSFF